MLSSDHNVKDWIIRNNRFYNNGVKGFYHSKKPNTLAHTAAVVLSRGKHQFYNNLVYNNHAGVRIWGRGHESLVANNTIYNNNEYGILVEIGIQKARLLNNLVWGNKVIQIKNNGTNTVEQPNLISDPKVINAAGADFRLQSISPARDKGVDIPEVLRDFNGILRPLGHYDMGALEYGALKIPSAPISLRIGR